MLSFFDMPALEQALSLPLDPQLRRLLRQRVDHLNAIDTQVRDKTYFLVVDDRTTADEIADELGWSPLTTPFDYVADHGGWFEMIVSAGNEAVFTLLIQDSRYADAALLNLCRPDG